MAHDVFISYSSQDKPVGDAVCAALEARGIRCWMAPRDILPGEDWGNSIVDAISSARVMVLVFSRNANESPHIKREVERAVHRGLVIIPFRIEDVMPEDSLEYFLGTPHWLDAITPPLEAHLERLAEVVASFLGRALPPPVPPPRQRSGPRRGVYALAGALVLVVIVLFVVLATKGGKGHGAAGGPTSSATTAAATSRSTTTGASTTTVTKPPSTSTVSTGGITIPPSPPAVLAGSWVVQDPPPGMTTWDLDLRGNGNYSETIGFGDSGSAKWGGGVNPAKPFANPAGPITVSLAATDGENQSATFTPVGPGSLAAEYLFPSGFATFLEESASYNPNQAITGDIASDHEWRAAFSAGDKPWALDFEANGPGYTFTAGHSEAGKWTSTKVYIELVPKSGPEAQLSYSSPTATTMELTLPGTYTLTFVRTS